MRGSTFTHAHKEVYFGELHLIRSAYYRYVILVGET